ncbi:hypothetical protein J8I87_30690 [Paraburkholderia sp. LEh10]|jgi:hypothetical protein|uniref:hypothetical protein n=1 Tax=Paraburkholderia sp. LEh10 TaxID=2821353 RepID=UPI001AE6A015|nr:hypothetical protein [Paraburkholderia sp. LEh10]MBP0593970.1 hypothetical protein [Paraburkholderia sp. LEh10]
MKLACARGIEVTAACALSLSTAAWLADNACAQAVRPSLEVQSEHVEIRRIPLARLDASLPADNRLVVFAITDRQGLYVMHAPGIADQGAMFSRVVALFERRDMPRDHIVTMAAIVNHARRFGTDAADLTAGNNFSSVELARFFDLSRRQHLVLTPGERALQRIVVRMGLIEERNGNWQARSTHDFLITIPGRGPAQGGESIDAPVRAAILSHELGHWQYFSDEAYAQACRSFWWRDLTYEERAELTRQLESMGYDASDRIVIDEMQAYLLHTPAPYMPLADVRGAGGIDVARIRDKLRQKVTEDGR